MTKDEVKNALQRIESKVDNLDSRQDVMEKHLAVYNEQLKIHIKRSELLEDKVDHAENRLEGEIAPIKAHVSEVSGIVKFIKWGIGTLVTIAAALVAYLKG